MKIFYMSFHRGNESLRNQIPVPSRSPSGKAAEPKVTVEVGPMEEGRWDLPISLCENHEVTEAPEASVSLFLNHNIRVLPLLL